MNTSVWFGLALGLLLFTAIAFAVSFAVLPRLMIPERRSAHTLDETVKRLSDAALAAGWVVQSIVELEKSIAKNGGGHVRPVRLVNICHARHAGQIMHVDSARRVSVLMPCTISVYEKNDDSVWVGAMNPSLVAPLFRGVVARVMGGPVADDQQRFINAATAP